MIADLAGDCKRMSRFVANPSGIVAHDTVCVKQNATTDSTDNTDGESHDGIFPNPCYPGYPWFNSYKPCHVPRHRCNQFLAAWAPPGVCVLAAGARQTILGSRSHSHPFCNPRPYRSNDGKSLQNPRGAVVTIPRLHCIPQVLCMP